MILTESCAAKRAIHVSRVRFRGDRHMMNNATPISMYRIVQTGANTTFGGLNQGLFSDAYHVGIELIVHTVDPNPANKGTAIDTTSLTTSTAFIFARCRRFLSANVAF